MGNHERITRTRVVRNTSDGRGAKAIARQVEREGVDCTSSDAQGWIDAFYDNYQRVRDYLQACRDAVYDPGYVQTPYGRRRHFQVVDDDGVMAAQEREAANMTIQGTVADALCAALVLVERERSRRGMQFKIVLAVHDEIMLEVPYHEVQEAIKLLESCMSERVEVPGVGLHYGVDTGVCLRWNEKLEDPDILKACGL